MATEIEYKIVFVLQRICPRIFNNTICAHLKKDYGCCVASQTLTPLPASPGFRLYLPFMPRMSVPEQLQKLLWSLGNFNTTKDLHKAILLIFYGLWPPGHTAPGNTVMVYVIRLPEKEIIRNNLNRSNEQADQSWKIHPKIWTKDHRKCTIQSHQNKLDMTGLAVCMEKRQEEKHEATNQWVPWG